MDKKVVIEILEEYDVKGLSYRSLAAKYGISHSTIYRMVMSRKNEQEKALIVKTTLTEETALPDDIKVLKEELRKARLKIELQDLMLDISSKELGIDLRKKHGTRRSR